MSTTHLVTVRAFGHGGEGIGHIDGDSARRTVFVRGAMPGEQVVAFEDGQNGKLLRTHVQTVQVASLDRVVPPCEYAQSCGGCSWQHVAADKQASYKAEIVNGQLRKVSAKVDAVHASDSALGYRRRARLQYRVQGNGLQVGFFREQSHEVVDIKKCLVLDGPCNHALTKLRELAEYLPGQGEIRLVSDGSRVLAGFIGWLPSEEGLEKARALLDDVLVGMSYRARRTRGGVGKKRLTVEDLPGLHGLVLEPFGFAQAHDQQNRRLVKRVVELTKPANVDVLELYCGVGNFTRALAVDAASLNACDDDRDSIAYLRKISQDHGWHVDARSKDVAPYLDDMAKDGRTFATCLLDPPRSGLGKESAAKLAKLVRERIVYVSCDVATMTRDIEVLVANGFDIQRTEVFDLMPMTPEVEVVVALKRRVALK